MGTSNIWSVNYIDSKEGKTTLSTSIGVFKLTYAIDRKITGIRIPPSSFKIVQEKSKDEYSFEFLGRVKSIIEKDENYFRLVVDLEDTHHEYIKVDCKKEILNIESDSNKVLRICVSSSEVVLI